MVTPYSLPTSPASLPLPSPCPCTPAPWQSPTPIQRRTQGLDVTG